MRKLFKAALKIGKTTFANIVTGVISNKFIALLLGPVGIGLIAKAKTFLNTSCEISRLGLDQGVGFMPLNILLCKKIGVRWRGGINKILK